ncbi:hypothetical protein D8S78_16325 [Natrialba swarupiae]|nr:hypothetical protein [Natrialba swarupiae]
MSLPVDRIGDLTRQSTRVGVDTNTSDRPPSRASYSVTRIRSVFERKATVSRRTADGRHRSVYLRCCRTSIKSYIVTLWAIFTTGSSIRGSPSNECVNSERRTPKTTSQGRGVSSRRS